MTQTLTPIASLIKKYQGIINGLDIECDAPDVFLSQKSEYIKEKAFYLRIISDLTALLPEEREDKEKDYMEGYANGILLELITPSDYFSQNYTQQ